MVGMASSPTDGLKPIGQDLIVGIKEISREIGMVPRKANYLAAAGLLPGVFKRGRQWVALRSEMAAGFRSLATSGIQGDKR